MSAVTNVVGALIGADATRKAANTQADAARYAADAVAAQKQPWVTAGTTGLNMLTAGLQPGGQFTKQFTMADAQNSDAMKFTLDQGMQALKNSEAARGGLLGTNALQEQTKYAEGVASTYQNQAFNQWLAQQTQLLGATESLAQTGQTASTQVADTTANAALAAGGAQAGAQVAQGNLWSKALTSTVNDQSTMTTLSNLFGLNSSSTGAGVISGGSGISGSLDTGSTQYSLGAASFGGGG